ncbi:FadR/GntR family transcriptional regulator [Novosphingobium rosa]|uniref:FadR/GntR family transcriptional regulator n=1 Tax=Novosphingobium rosa TaxID=76978 RepID=UPI00082BE85D|nr:FadR/GntR family transcriptional regulator [Novosphingobium rosa]
MAGRRLFQDIADKIAAMIAEGAFPPGSRLPGERELAEKLGVSRVTVREAAIALQARGMVRIKTGSGIYITDRAVETVDDLPAVSAFELTEARALFESEAAALAAPIISDSDLAKLNALLNDMSHDDADAEQATASDREFHMTIAAASGNRAIIHVVNTLWRMRTELSEVREAHASICHHDGMTRQDEHGAIVKALEEHDAKGARLAMRQHFGRLLEAMLDANEQQELIELQRKAAESRERFLMSSRMT